VRHGFARKIYVASLFCLAGGPACFQNVAPISAAKGRDIGNKAPVIEMTDPQNTSDPPSGVAQAKCIFRGIESGYKSVKMQEIFTSAKAYDNKKIAVYAYVISGYETNWLLLSSPGETNLWALSKISHDRKGMPSVDFQPCRNKWVLVRGMFLSDEASGQNGFSYGNLQIHEIEEAEGDSQPR
jgi:hypothetical protein